MKRPRDPVAGQSAAVPAGGAHQTIGPLPEHENSLEIKRRKNREKIRKGNG